MVYVLKHPTLDAVKIGFTDNLKRRLRAYQTHAPPGTALLATIPLGTRDTERRLHERLRRYRLSRRGEWFRWTPFVQSVIEDYTNPQRHYVVDVYDPRDGWRPLTVAR